MPFPLKDSMENSLRDKSRRGYSNFRRLYDVSMALLFLAMGGAMFFLERLGADLAVVEDTGFRYFFGSVCLLYGGFRLYRGIKHTERI